MTMRTIDLQVMIPKVSEVSRVQQIQNQQEQVQQQQFADEFVKTTDRKKQQVGKANKGQEAKIEKDKSNRKQPQQQRQGTAEQHIKSAEDEVIEAKDPKRGNLFDIKI